MSVPYRQVVGQYTIICTPDICLITITKKGLLVPIAVHTINFDDNSQIQDKYDEAVQWCEDN